MKIWAILPFLALSFCTTVRANPLQVYLETKNTGHSIGDGQIVAHVSGGLAPYHFYWSQQSTPQTDSLCLGVEEGRVYRLVVTDQQNQTAQASVEIAPGSVPERMNSFFVPIVEAIGVVLFWDPLRAMGIRDGTITDASGQLVRHPNGDPVIKPVRFIVLWLIAGALFFTCYMRFVNIRGFRHSIAVSLGRYDDPNEPGEVSHFQALATALSGTLGLGNIAGVAIAIAIGGAGATFWMIVAGLLGMSSKFVECTLGVKYRVINEHGETSGGPMYYLSKGLDARGWPRLGKILAFLFALLCVGGAIGGGNMFQANQVMAQIATVVPAALPFSWLVGAIMAILVGLVMVGGIKSIAGVTDKLVPFMVGVYILFSLVIIGMHVGEIGHALRAIFFGAFDAEAVSGGLVGVMMTGFQRAAFSNEAGIGSASIAHSASRTSKPVSEGMISLMEPFIDTVVVCTITALVLVFTGYAENSQGLTASQLTNAAFTSEFAWFQWVLLISIFFFAYATMLSWGYYGFKSWTYLWGNGLLARRSYQFIYLICTWLGAMVGLGAVMDFSDMMILGMALPNVIGLLIMAREVKTDMNQYFSDLKAGKIKRFR